MAHAEALPVDAASIPVIDITPLRDGAAPRRVAQALHDASRKLGFIYVSGHGIPDESVARARAEALDFFHRPVAEKETVAVSPKHRGWIGQGGAVMGDGLRADLKESFVWGFQDEAGETPDDHELRGPNRWPPCQPGLMAASMDFFAQAHRVAHHLMRGFALGLDLDPDFFLRSASRPLSRASYVYYPAQPPGSGAAQFGVGPHTDFGVLTVLCQDDVGGLQVQAAGGDWIAAPPIPGTLVVNVADLLSRWTGGAYRSTPHRVVNTSGRDRLSLVLAFDPDPETVIDPRDLFGPLAEGLAEPITCGDYLVWRFGKAFAYRNRR